jgi:hypothetical protein
MTAEQCIRESQSFAQTNNFEKSLEYLAMAEKAYQNYYLVT